MDSPGHRGPAAGTVYAVTLSTCPFCSAGCGVLLQTRDGEVLGVAPAQRHPTSRGRLCARGWCAHEAPFWGQRLLVPTVKDRSGHRRVSWDEALATAARQLRALVVSGKRVGVLGSGRVTNEEAFLGVRLGRDALETSHVDVSLQSSFQALLGGLRPDGGTLTVPALAEAFRDTDLLILLEDDLSRSHPQVAFSLLQAVKDGARLVSVGLARTQMAALSDRWLPLDPLGPSGGPPGLEEALGDPALTGKVVAVLAPCFSSADRLRTTVEDLSRRVERWAGSPGPEIQYVPLPFLVNSRGAYEMGFAPGILPGVRYLYDQTARNRLRAEWGPAVRLEDGLGAEAMLRELDGLVLIRDDPHEWHASPANVRAALEKMDCVIVLDAYSSSASERATVTLPVGTFTEEEGTLVSLDGLIQRWTPARSLPAEVKQGWRVLADLLRSLGIQVAYRSVRDVTEEIGRVFPEFPAGDPGYPDGAWTRRLRDLRIHREEPSRRLHDQPAPEERALPHTPDVGHPLRIALWGAREWGDDPGVANSPTLKRDRVAERKLFPRGRIAISRADAGRMGLRDGWTVRVRSQRGEVEVPLSVSDDVEPGSLLAPFGFREQLKPVLGEGGGALVSLERL